MGGEGSEVFPHVPPGSSVSFGCCGRGMKTPLEDVLKVAGPVAPHPAPFWNVSGKETCTRAQPVLGILVLGRLS